MKKEIIYLVVISLLGFSGIGAAKTIFITQEGKGNGESWENALSNIQIAISIAGENDQIWVKAGTYYPSKTGNRKIPFFIDKSVQLFGGFSGTEIELSERDFYQNQTIFSGEIGNKTIAEDNSHNIFLIDLENGQVVLDGFTLKNGMANISSHASDRTASGGSIFYASKGNKCHLWIKNCLFLDNQALYGGAITAFSSMGCNSHIYIDNCVFQQNTASIEGGAIYHYASAGSTVLLDIKHTTFTQNLATFGGAIYHKAEKGAVTSPRVSFSDFALNMAYVRGSCIYRQEDEGEETSASDPLFIDCSFFDNKETVGNAMGDSNNIRKSQNTLDRIIIRPTLRTSSKRKVP
jgi:predicted outer membrane repeat protein